MKVEQFAMERMQSTYENEVEFNLSESGVHPMTLGELIQSDAAVTSLLEQELGYTQSNGTIALREAIAALYPGSTVDHLQVTNGGSEANFVTVWNLVEPGDEVVMMVPNYMQTWGLARAYGATVREWPLRETATPAGVRWRADLDELEALVNPRTKMIIICNPNNPTGARLEADEIEGVCRVAARYGAWLLSDEIYRGAERDGVETPTVWGRYDRAIVTNGLSKAYGLPGLRIGWIAAAPSLIASLWSYHDYITIAPGALSDRLARLALVPDVRRRILGRTRDILNSNYPIVDTWLRQRGEHFSHVDPDAGAIVYVRYSQPINSNRLVTDFRERKSVLVVPGDHFRMDGYLRIGFGAPAAYLREGLRRLHELLAEIEVAPASSPW